MDADGLTVSAEERKRQRAATLRAATRVFREAGPLVYSMRAGALPPPADAVRVDRATAWGNPFPLSAFPTREACVTAFRVYAVRRLEGDPLWLEPLRGRNLLCWCKSPGEATPCHADVLLELANLDP